MRIPPAPDNRLNDHRRDFMTMRRHQAGKAHHIALIPFAIHAALRGGSKQVFWQVAFPQTVH